MEEKDVILEQEPDIVEEPVLTKEIPANEADEQPPKQKCKLKLNLKTVTALLLVLVMLFSIPAIFASKPMAGVQSGSNRIKQAKADITDMEASIVKAEEDIEIIAQEIDSMKELIPDYEAALEDAKTAAAPFKTALDDAEAALDAVCTRGYYSTYFCSLACQSLHNDVSTAKDALSDANTAVKKCENELENCNDNILYCENEIARLNSKIASTENSIAETKEYISEMRSQSIGQWVILIVRTLGIIVGLCGLALLIKLLLSEKQPKKCMLLACTAIAGAALFFFIFTAIASHKSGIPMVLFFFLNPFTYTLFAMAMFARILMKKAKKPVVCRTAAIVAAVAAGLVATVLYGGFGSSATMFAHVLFAIAMICLAFVIEPLVFTEYINIAKHIFLSLITCGIWSLVWIYHVTKNLNAVPEVEERTPRNELLLCMFLPFFQPFWMFKTAEYVESYGLDKDKSFHLEAPVLVFAFLCPLFATVMIQNKINVAVGKPEALPE